MDGYEMDTHILAPKMFILIQAKQGLRDTEINRLPQC